MGSWGVVVLASDSFSIFVLASLTRVESAGLELLELEHECSGLNTGALASNAILSTLSSWLDTDSADWTGQKGSALALNVARPVGTNGGALAFSDHFASLNGRRCRSHDFLSSSSD